jgi:hypothetical protein
MGRPLNKKYFGNRNIGSTSTTADNKIGGEGVASISVATAGSFVVNDTYKNFPLLNIGAPTIPGGVQATADVVFEINTVTFSSGGQTNADYVAGLSTTITGLGGGAIVNITEVASKVTAVDVTTAGTNRGEFRRGDAFDGTGITTFQVLQAPNAGTDLQVNITFRVKSITIVEQGSGYVSVPNLSWNGHTFTGQTSPSGNTPALTVDTGAVGSATYEENAILMTARLTGGSATLVDIIKQTNDRRYKVTDGTRTGIVQLKSSVATAVGECSVRLVDTDGGTYFATKITAHKATIQRGTGTQAAFTNGKQVKWNMTAATADSLLIDNA